ncbi:MAG TPA: 2-dehydropantoate 2-reductase N-terminal domain-containing protein [Kofleriaceae bacterium]|jgi:2-dehydropantoate 2-reductase|nr:2-dehydropantoate 2-reductase N-terminal domain-containing protein [Kofleriaceae bacterium]
MGVTDEAGPLLIWGAGAVGGAIGAHLARAGHPVVVVDIVAEHVAAIAEHGLTLEGPLGGFTQRLPAFTPDQLTGRYRRSVLCVKAQHTAGAAAAMRPFLADDGYVVSAQNGLNERVIAGVVGRARTIGAFVNFGADYLGPGRIVHGGRGAVVIGEIDGQATPRLAALHRTLLDFEPGAITTDNIWGYLWGKLAYGALLFATALTPDSIADALALPQHAALYRALGAEVLGVAAAEQVRAEGFNGFDPAAFVAGADPAAAQRSIDAMVAHNRRSAKSHSGIWRDLAIRNRKTEVDAQIAIIGELAASHGQRTPLIVRLVELVHEIEDGQRPIDRGNLDALAGAMR